MPPVSRHLSREIMRPAQDVYTYLTDARNLPRWAAGVSTAVDLVDGRWVSQAPMGEVVIEFASANDFGVADHTVTLPDGSSVHNPMRVLPLAGGCEVVFTARPTAGMTDQDFDTDCAAVLADLATLRDLLESGAD